MYLTRYCLRNFRRLEDVEIKLEKEDTIFVGTNNSGKTSATVAFRLFVSPRGDFKIHDFSSPLIPKLDSFGELDIQPDVDYGKELPAIELGELVKRCRLFYGGSFRPHPRVTRIIGHVR